MSKFLKTCAIVIASMTMSTIALASGALGFQLGESMNNVITKLQKDGIAYEDFGDYAEKYEKLGVANVFPLEGLKVVVLGFDKDTEKLSYIHMTIHKDNIKSMIATLDKKYKSVSRNIPFVGNIYVTYKLPDGQIIVDAPHLSFDSTVRYETKEFTKYVNQYEAKLKKQRQETKDALL